MSKVVFESTKNENEALSHHLSAQRTFPWAVLSIVVCLFFIYTYWFQLFLIAVFQFAQWGDPVMGLQDVHTLGEVRRTRRPRPRRRLPQTATTICLWRWRLQNQGKILQLVFIFYLFHSHTRTPPPRDMIETSRSSRLTLCKCRDRDKSRPPILVSIYFNNFFCPFSLTNMSPLQMLE